MWLVRPRNLHASGAEREAHFGTMIAEFFKNLLKSRVQSVQNEAVSKAKSYQAQARSKAASKVNKVLDAPVNKVRDKANAAEKQAKAAVAGKAVKKDDAKKDDGSKSGGSKADAKPDAKGAAAAPKGESVGWFSSKKKPAAAPSSSRAAPPPQQEYDPGGKTQAIDISGIVDDRAQDVVGWIVCLNGALQGKDFRLVTGKNVMGTAADCDIVLTDAYLSSKHAVIRHEEGRYTLVDLDSTNGTFVNDKRVSKWELIDNDTVRVGRTEMKFKSLF